jgi:hypothetical protein
VHEQLHAGGIGDVRGPRNHVASVGVAAATGAQWELHVGGRTAASMAFREELAAPGSRVRPYPEDEVGLLPLEDVLGAVGRASASAGTRTAGPAWSWTCAPPGPFPDRSPRADRVTI